MTRCEMLTLIPDGEMQTFYGVFLQYVNSELVFPFVAMFPHVHIDTYPICNARCIFCGNKNMTRDRTPMNMDLFKRAVDQIARWNHPIEIVPIHYGEFFINPLWFEQLQYIQDVAPKCSIGIPTNGSVLDDKKLDLLMSIKNLKHVGLSVYSCVPTTYTRVMGLGGSTIDKLRHAAQRIRTERPDILLNIGTTRDPEVGISQEDYTAFHNEWKQQGFAVGSHPITRNINHGHGAATNRRPCFDVFVSMVILNDGRVCICCFDVNGDEIIGDMKKDSLIDIWRGTTAKRHRELHSFGLRNRIKLCSTCNKDDSNIRVVKVSPTL